MKITVIWAEVHELKKFCAFLPFSYPLHTLYSFFKISILCFFTPALIRLLNYFLKSNFIWLRASKKYFIFRVGSFLKKCLIKIPLYCWVCISAIIQHEIVWHNSRNNIKRQTLFNNQNPSKINQSVIKKLCYSVFTDFISIMQHLIKTT